ncbi:DUF5335 family protein [Massilia cavernae]|uniref:Uncharacterized protein n=1 Tax=Massilia cavernae TaxID=2320864 RepID=A0A418Y4E5_9BURK|nr:DUF5335 family protein [Massilia cavernae]RJG20525.1 hypothetical protein D3872_08285 [Massilia cavernae]
MSIEKLDKQAWHAYFDAVSKRLPGMQAEIDVQSLKIGAQVESQFAPLIGIVYDQKSQILEVVLEGWDHTVPDVAEIWIDHDGVVLKSVKVVDNAGVEQIIRLRSPLALPLTA